MESIRQAKEIIRNRSESDLAKVLILLIEALKNDQAIRLSVLDSLGYEDCQRSLQLILDWRVARHYYDRI